MSRVVVVHWYGSWVALFITQCHKNMVTTLGYCLMLNIKQFFFLLTTLQINGLSHFAAVLTVRLVLSGYHLVLVIVLFKLFLWYLSFLSNQSCLIICCFVQSILEMKHVTSMIAAATVECLVSLVTQAGLAPASPSRPLLSVWTMVGGGWVTKTGQSLRSTSGWNDARIPETWMINMVNNNVEIQKIFVFSHTTTAHKGCYYVY